MFVIKAKKRDATIKLDGLRKGGEIPAVFYGAGKETTSISIPIVEFKKVWREAGESSAIKIEMLDKNIDPVRSRPLEDESATVTSGRSASNGVDVLIHEVQVDPITDEPIHVDFLVIDMKKKIRVNVPLVFEGISDAVKSGIGNLVKVMYEFEIEALPSDLPHNLVVDISKLKTLNDQIFVSDVKLPVGVAVINEPTEVVVSVVEQVEEKEEVVAPVDLSAIEVEKKGKKEEEEAEGTETASTIPVKEEKTKTDKK